MLQFSRWSFRSVRSNPTQVFAVLAMLLTIWGASGCGGKDHESLPPDGDDESVDESLDADAEETENAEWTEEEAESPEMDYEAWSLDEPCPMGEVRAGVMTKDSQGIPGPQSQGATGDIKLFNGRVAFVIAAVGPGRGLARGGGGILDAAVVDESGATSPDLLVEAFPLLASLPGVLPYDGTLRQLDVQSVRIINDGHSGFPARVRVTGRDWPLPWLEALVELPVLNPRVSIMLDYVLEADATQLKIEATVSLEETSEEFVQEAVNIGFAIVGDSSLSPFYPGVSIDGHPKPEEIKGIYTKNVDFLALDRPDAGYGFGGGEGQKLNMVVLPSTMMIAVSGTDMVLTKGLPGPDGVPVPSASDSLIFVAGSGSSNAVFQTINGYRYRLHPGTEIKAAKAEGSVELAAELKDTPVAVLATKLESTGTSDNPWREVVAASTWVDKEGKFGLQLPPGEYELYAQSNTRDISDAMSLKLAAYELAGGLKLASPASAALVTISVSEQLSDTEGGGLIPVSARVDIYQGLEIKPENYRQTVFTSPDEPVRTRLAMQGQRVAYFTLVASHGPMYNVETRQMLFRSVLAEGEVQGPTDLVLKKVLDPVLVLPALAVPSDAATDGDSDAEAPAGPRTMRAFGVLAGIAGERSLLSRVSQSSRAAEAEASGAALALSADAHRVSDYSAFEQTSTEGARAPLSWLSGLALPVPNSRFVGFHVHPATGRPAAFGIPFNSETEDGSYNGRRPIQDILEDLQSDYDATFIMLSQPRGSEARTAFFQNFGISAPPDTNAYDPHQGLQALSYEGRNSLSRWNTLEVLTSAQPFTQTYRVLQDWFSLLNEGVRKPAMAGSGEAEETGPEGARLDFARNLVFLENAPPYLPDSQLALDALAKGSSAVTTGPILMAHIKGVAPGETYTLKNISADFEYAQLHVRAEAPAWMPVNRLAVCVNGVTQAVTDITGDGDGLRYEGDLEIRFDARDTGDGITRLTDGWVVVMAFGDPGKTLAPVGPELPVFALTNPIYIESGKEGLDKVPLVPDGSIYCGSEALCDLFARYDSTRRYVRTAKECCGLYPTKSYCQD